MTIANLEGYFTQVNPALERTLGWTSTEITTRPYIELVHPDYIAATVAEAQKLSQGLTPSDLKTATAAKIIPTAGFHGTFQLSPNNRFFIVWLAMLPNASKPKPNYSNSAALIDNSTDFIGIATPEGKGVYVNRLFAVLWT